MGFPNFQHHKHPFEIRFQVHLSRNNLLNLHPNWLHAACEAWVSVVFVVWVRHDGLTLFDVSLNFFRTIIDLFDSTNYHKAPFVRNWYVSYHVIMENDWLWCCLYLRFFDTSFVVLKIKCLLMEVELPLTGIVLGSYFLCLTQL